MKYILISLLTLMLFGCQAKRQVVQTETVSTKESAAAPISEVQANDPPEIVACMNDLAAWRKSIRVISRKCRYDEKLDHDIAVTSYRAGALDGWQSGKLANIKMKYFGILAFSRHYPFDREDLDAINNAIDHETKNHQRFEAEAEQRKNDMFTPETCIESDMKVYLYDMGWGCAMFKTADTQCNGYRESFLKVCGAAGVPNCTELYNKERPQHCL